MSTEKPRQMKGFGSGRGGAAMMSPKQKIEKGTFKRLCERDLSIGRWYVCGMV